MAFDTSIARPASSTRTTRPPADERLRREVAPVRDREQRVEREIDALGDVVVPGDDHDRAARTVLGLREQIGGDPGRVDGRVAHDRDLRRSGEPVDPDDGRDDALRRGGVGVPGPDDDVDRPDRLGAVGHRRDRPAPPDAVQLVDVGERPRRRGPRRRPTRRHAAGSTRRPRPRRRRAPAPRSSADSTRAARRRRARSSRPGRRERPARARGCRSVRGGLPSRAGPRARRGSGRGRTPARRAGRDRCARAPPPTPIGRRRAHRSRRRRTRPRSARSAPSPPARTASTISRAASAIRSSSSAGRARSARRSASEPRTSMRVSSDPAIVLPGK